MAQVTQRGLKPSIEAGVGPRTSRKVLIWPISSPTGLQGSHVPSFNSGCDAMAVAVTPWKCGRTT